VICDAERDATLIGGSFSLRKCNDNSGSIHCGIAANFGVGITLDQVIAGVTCCGSATIFGVGSSGVQSVCWKLQQTLQLESLEVSDCDLGFYLVLMIGF